VTRTALVTGVGGQDGVLAARRLLADGLRVVGTTRPDRGAGPMAPYLDGVEQVSVDLRDIASLTDLIEELRPDEIYHLAAVTTVGAGWARPDEVEAVNVDAVDALVAAVCGVIPEARVFLASSSEVFGPDAANPQDETTPLSPQNPYARSKASLHRIAETARAAGTFVSVGILYNHESPIRPVHFVTRKVARAAAEIASGRRESLSLGNLHTSRDWSAAEDVVDAMVRMARAESPRDYVVASGRLHTIRELVEAAFGAAGVGDPWSHVAQDPDLMRSGDATGWQGDASLLRAELGWTPTTPFEDLIGSMVHADLRRLESGVEEDPAYLE